MQHQRLNNNQYILTSLQKFGILNFIALTTPEFEATYKGQAHNIFSQILRIRICNFFLTNIMYHLFWFSQLFDQQEICFLFQKLRNIGKKDSYLENLWKHILSSIKDMIMEHKRLYFQSWTKVLGYIWSKNTGNLFLVSLKKMDFNLINIKYLLQIFLMRF